MQRNNERRCGMSIPKPIRALSVAALLATVPLMSRGGADGRAI